jgi:predicted nucleic-acid-binding Zn-ribbon protein
MKEYSVEEKLRGQDLHGLPCRVPTPTAEQAKCSHSKWVEKEERFLDWMLGEWFSVFRNVEEDTFEDIPNTNNFRCTQCGYTRRY